jgi:cell division protein FtsA
MASTTLTGKLINSGRQGVIAALDVGSNKVACFIARLDHASESDAGVIRIMGIGHQVSRGIRSGVVVDMEAAEDAIRAAVEAAEKMAGVTIRSVVVNLTNSALVSHSVAVDVSIAGHEVREQDLTRVLNHGRGRAAVPDRQVIHAIPVGYSIDGSRGIRDPRGMFGERLGVNMNVVSAAQGPIRNLAICVERCHLQVGGFVVSPYASGLSCLVEDEMDLGVTCIDMGGGATSIAVFFDGNLLYTDVIPVGGNHVTNDIARGLATPVSHAERMKTLYGSALASPSDDQEMINVPQVGEDEADVFQIPRSMLTGIIQPRLEETLELVRDRLAQSNAQQVAGRRVVLTGGASQMNGIRELAARILEKQVRLGRPIRIAGLAESTGGPAFSTCAGLLNFSNRAPAEALTMESDLENVKPGGQLAKIGRWLKENF